MDARAAVGAIVPSAWRSGARAEYPSGPMHAVSPHIGP